MEETESELSKASHKDSSFSIQTTTTEKRQAVEFFLDNLAEGTYSWELSHHIQHRSDTTTKIPITNQNVGRPYVKGTMSTSDASSSDQSSIRLNGKEVHQSRIFGSDEHLELMTSYTSLHQVRNVERIPSMIRAAKGVMEDVIRGVVKEDKKVISFSDDALVREEMSVHEVMTAKELRESTGSEGSTHTDEEPFELECAPFAGVQKYASTVVKGIIGQSIETLINMGNEVEVPSETVPYGIMWPKIIDFDVELGMATLYAFLATWPLEEEWAYCIEFMMPQSDSCSEYYLYEAKFSIPTNPYPVPQALTTVYFTIEVSRVKPNYCPVTCTYIFEGTRTVHSATEELNWEKCLFRVINAKLALYKTLDF